MDVFEDLLSTDKVQQQLLEFEPELCHGGFTFEPPALFLALHRSEQKVNSIELELRINTVKQAMKLGDLFRACGYKDPREVSAMMYTPHMTVHLFFSAKPEVLSQYIQALQAIKEPAEIFALKDAEDKAIFVDLDRAFDFLRIEARSEQPVQN